MARSNEDGEQKMTYSSSVELSRELVSSTAEYLNQLRIDEEDELEYEAYYSKQQFLVSSLQMLGQLTDFEEVIVKEAYSKCYDMELEIQTILSLRKLNLGKKIEQIQRGKRLKTQYESNSAEPGLMLDKFK